MVGLNMKKSWNKFLNWLIPGRRIRILARMVQQNQKTGQYECCGKWDEFGKCSCGRK